MSLPTNFEDNFKKLQEIDSREKLVRKTSDPKSENLRRDQENDRINSQVKLFIQDYDRKKSELDEKEKILLSLSVQKEAWSKVLDTNNKTLIVEEELLGKSQLGIWIEREHFCDKIDEFLEERGILSKWWQDIVGDLKKTDAKQRRKDLELVRNRICNIKQEIHLIEEDVLELEKKIEEEESRKTEEEQIIEDLLILRETLMSVDKNMELVEARKSLIILQEQNLQLHSKVLEKADIIKQLEENRIVNFKTTRRDVPLTQCNKSTDAIQKYGQSEVTEVQDLIQYSMKNGPFFTAKHVLEKNITGFIPQSLQILQSINKPYPKSLKDNQVNPMDSLDNMKLLESQDTPAETSQATELSKREVVGDFVMTTKNLNFETARFIPKKASNYSVFTMNANDRYKYLDTKFADFISGGAKK